jgi:oxygen-dependent protoporphyrinogen oxidase
MSRVAIVGGGLSGLATAFYILKESNRVGLKTEITLLESGPRLGGKISTVATKGFHCETGPNGFLDNAPETLDLVDLLGIEDRMVRSNDAARRRFILSGGRLHQLPEGPLAFMGSNLLSFRGRARLIGELFVPRKKKRGASKEDETVASFIRRRLGSEVLDKLIDPMVSGVYAGDPAKMSIASCFPKIVALEEEYGGLIRGMIAKQRAARSEGKEGPGAGPGGTLMSFRHGLQELIDAMAARLGERARVSAPVASLSTYGEGSLSTYEVKMEKGDPVVADAVVVAAPAYAAAGIIGGLSPETSSLLKKIPYSPLSVVHFGYDRADVKHDLNGFGFLVPSSERRRILGSLWSSSIFDERAPSRKVLMTTMVGGARSPQTARLRSGDLTSVVKAELQRTIRQSAPPDFTLITRWERAIPQYRPGHGRLLKDIDGQVERRAGLFLTGNAYRGIGVNDCVRAAIEIAPRVVAHLARRV